MEAPQGSRKPQKTPKRLQEVPGDSKRLNGASGGFRRRLQGFPGGFRRPGRKRLQEGSRRPQEAPAGPRRLQQATAVHRSRSPAGDSKRKSGSENMIPKI